MFVDGLVGRLVALFRSYALESSCSLLLLALLLQVSLLCSQTLEAVSAVVREVLSKGLGLAGVAMRGLS